MPETRPEPHHRATTPKPGDMAREGQLRIARSLKSAGHMHEAIHLLNDLLDNHSQGPEAREVIEEIESIAQDCERRGFIYAALDLYRHLDRLQ